jgi:hypothetical protein
VKKHLLIFFLLLSLTSPAVFAQRKAVPKATNTPKATSSLLSDKSIEVPIVTKTLPNGLEVIVLRDTAVPLATVELAVRNGSFTLNICFSRRTML